jgi:ribosomal protein S12 methylthiotransferase accessory factor
MYAEGVIEDDDEVALAFDPDSLRPVSDPMVNIRHAVEQLRRPGTIDAKTAQRILRAAKKRHYRERNFRQALRDSGLAQRADSQVLLQMLQRFDLKRDDAVTLLESLATRRMARVQPARARPSAPARARRAAPRGSDIYLWEYGESVPFDTLLAFTHVMGTFPGYARNAAARLLLSGGTLRSTHTPDVDAADLNRRVVDLRVQWSWLSAEELQVTLAHLGSTPDELLRQVGEEEQASVRLAALVRADKKLFAQALRGELILNDLALKREAIRAGTICLWAERALSGGGPPARPEEVNGAKALICERLNVLDWERALKVLARWSLAADEAEAWATRLALARRWGIALRRAMAGKSPVRVRSLRAGPNPLRLRPRKKRPGDRRFATAPSVGSRALPRLCAAVGVTRVGVVTGLDRTGIPIAHAFRPDGLFSSTIGSGKAFTPQGAKIGAVMEETEKWCQERFPNRALAAEQLSGTYAEVAARHPAISPRLLNLPHDSRYAPKTSLRWIPCWDLLAGQRVFVPTAALCFERLHNDPFYSAWLAEKVFDTNGLASAFTIEEALVHAICEVIERHSVKVAVISSENPGGPRQRLRVVNARTTPESSQSLIRKLTRGGARVSIADVTSEVRVPAFLVRIKRERAPVYEFF